MARGPRWKRIPATPARFQFETVSHEGVSVLCVRLSGYAQNTPSGVSAIRDALDAIPATLEDPPRVSTLDCSQFANASDDACEILTSVFTGTPCCWIYHSPDEQVDHRRWDLPPRERLAPTRTAALERVAQWSRSGGFVITYSNGQVIERARWTERGLVLRCPGGDDWRTEDLYFRNGFVERRIADEQQSVVRWPVVDATGAASDATRAGARLLYQRGRVVECDFSPWQTRAALPDDWPQRIAPFDGLVKLQFGAARPSMEDLLDALRAHPTIAEVELWREGAEGLDLQRLRARGVSVRVL